MWFLTTLPSLSFCVATLSMNLLTAVQSLHSGYSSLVRAGIQLAAIGDIIPIGNLIADSGSASRYPAAIWRGKFAFVVPTDSTIISFAVHIIVVYAAIVDIIASIHSFCRLRILSTDVMLLSPIEPETSSTRTMSSGSYVVSVLTVFVANASSSSVFSVC